MQICTDLGVGVQGIETLFHQIMSSGLRQRSNTKGIQVEPTRCPSHQPWGTGALTLSVMQPVWVENPGLHEGLMMPCLPVPPAHCSCALSNLAPVPSPHPRPCSQSPVQPFLLLSSFSSAYQWYAALLTFYLILFSPWAVR